MTEHSPEEKLNKRGRYRLSNLLSTWFAEQTLWTDGSRRVSQQPGFAPAARMTLHNMEGHSTASAPPAPAAARTIAAITAWTVAGSEGQASITAPRSAGIGSARCLCANGGEPTRRNLLSRRPLASAEGRSRKPLSLLRASVTSTEAGFPKGDLGRRSSV